MATIPHGTISSLSTFDENREVLRRLLTGANDPDSKASRLSRRASLLCQMYENSGRDNALPLEEAIAAARAAVQRTSTRDRFYRPARLSDLSRLLQMLHEHPTVRTQSSDQQRTHIAAEAITTAREAADSTPQDDRSGNRAARYSRLAHLQLGMRFKATKDLNDLDEAIAAARTAVEATPPGHIHEAARRGVLAQALETRFKHGHDAQDLGKAIQEAKLAVRAGDTTRPTSTAAHQRGHAGRVGHLALMCSRLWLLQRDSGDIRLLDDAVLYGRLAESLTPDSDPKKAARLRNVSMMLVRRYEAQGSVVRKKVDIDDAVQLAWESLARTASEEDEKLGSRRAHLARVQLARYEHLGDEADLDSAIVNAKKALGTPGTKWHQCTTLTLLGTAHQLLFRRSLDSKHLEMAIQFAQGAAEEMPRAAGTLSNLAAALQLGFGRFRKPKFLDDALAYAEKALEASQGSQYSDSDRAARHSDLADIYVTMTRVRSVAAAAGNIGLLDKALHHALMALQLTRGSDPHRPRRLSIYGSTVASLRQRLPNAQVPSLDQTIQEVEEMVSSGTVAGQYLGALRTNLGRMFEARGDQDRARAVYEQVGMSSSSLPMMRILALRKAGVLYADDGDWPRALDMFRKAISLLSQGKMLQSLRLDDHEDTLSQLSGLASLSPAVALKAGESHREALVWAERGRGVIAKLAVNAPLHLIQDPPGDGRKQDSNGNNFLGYFNRLLITPRKTWRSLRGLPPLPEHEPTPISRPIGGILADVEKKLTDAELRKLAEPGPIISYNTTKHGSGAFIITAQHGVRFAPLPNLHHTEVGLKARLLNNIRNSTRYRLQANNSLGEEILPWLWTTAVEPVLRRLGYTGDASTTAQDGRLPRVWWVSGGLLGSFPLHAAGTDWTPRSRDCALRRVVSSYVPSVMGLWLARAGRSTTTTTTTPPSTKPRARAAEQSGSGPGLTSAKQQQQLLFVSVPQPADKKMPALNVADELAALRQSARGVLQIEELRDPAKRTVLDRLAADEATVVHFACHGTSEQEQPSKSALLLKEERLTAGELMTLDVRAGAGAGAGEGTGRQRRLVRAELAYLSACSVAKNGSPELVDEAIHLASALFLFGFPNVVGPLWEVLDRSALQVTEAFYARLAGSLFGVGSDGKGGQVMQRVVADALHEATLARLQSGKERLDYASWASFIHIGT